MDDTKYHYSAKVIDVHDGDTIRCDIDLGFGIILKNQAFRFFGINAPELHGDSSADGHSSQEFVSERILNKDIIIVSVKDKKEKFGRWLGKIYYHDGDHWVELNKELLDKNMAIKFMDDGEDV